MKKNLGKTLSLPVGYEQPSALERIMADRDRGIAQEQSQYHTAQNTHNSSWQNSQTFISLLGQKEQEIKSHEKSYQTLSGAQKTEFINLIKSTALDPLKHELKNNYFEPDVHRSFKASIERLESVIDSWATGVIQQPKQPNPNYLKLDQYTSQQLSAKEFVEKYNNSIDFIEKQRVSLDQLTHDKKLEVIAQIKSKLIYSLEQQLRTGMYSPNARDEYERAIKKLVSTINDLELVPVINEQPNQNIPDQNNQQQAQPNNQENEDQEMIEQLRAQLEQLRLQMEQRDNTIEQQANDLITKDNIIADKDNIIADKDNIIADKDQEIADKDQEIADKDQEIADKDQEIADKDEVILHLQTENHDLTDRLATSEENNEILQNENQTLTNRLTVSEEKNAVLQNKLDISEAKVMPLQEKVADLKHYNEKLEKYNDDLKNDKVELREFNKMVAEYNKSLQKEKDLLLVDKKHFQDLNQEQAFKITELSQIHCNDPDHKEWGLLNMPIIGKDSNIMQNDSD